MTSKPVVTMFEAYGSGASVVGPRVAALLGVPWIGQSVSSDQLEAADPKGTGRINVRQFVTSLSFIDATSVHLLEDPQVAIARDQVRIVRELVAADGGVVLGRNGTVILADVPHALHVKLDAPVTDRIERAAREAGISLEQAALRQRREDAARAEISMEIFHWDPRLTAQYDLLVNTSTFGLDDTVQLIVEAYHRHAARVA